MTVDVLAKVPTDLYIGGAWVPASEGGRFDVTDPSNGKVIAQVADGSVEDALSAVGAAHDAGQGLGRNGAAGAGGNPAPRL
jgi:succinate-semialdehyde dehydrogenase/glutarate-semialdehyde dehydrogenase